MIKFIIDTNTFLDFYRSSNDALQILDEVKNNKEQLVFSEQVYREFMRNRVTELDSLKSNFKNSVKLNVFSSSILNSLELYIEIQDLRRSLNEKAKVLVRTIDDMINNSERDPVCTKVNELFHTSGVQVIDISDDDISNARKRKLLGNPPTSKDKTSIGDEVIWESIISKCEYDIVIVSRDKTYVRNIDFLRTEYFSKTGKQILKITDKITDAINLIGSSAPPEVIEIETRQLEERGVSIKEMVGEIHNAMDHFSRYGIYDMGCVVCGGAMSQLQQQCHHCGNRNPFYMQDDDL